MSDDNCGGAAKLSKSSPHLSRIGADLARTSPARAGSQVVYQDLRLHLNSECEKCVVERHRTE